MSCGTILNPAFATREETITWASKNGYWGWKAWAKYSMKLYEIEDCNECPIKDEGICSGSNDILTELPCANWNKEEDVEDYILKYYIFYGYPRHSGYPEHQNCSKEGYENKRKNEVATKKCYYLRSRCWKEIFKVDCIKRRIRGCKERERLANYSETTITKKLKSLQEELKVAEQKFREKQKECRSTEEYKNIGELCIANRK